MLRDAIRQKDQSAARIRRAQTEPLADQASAKIKVHSDSNGIILRSCMGIVPRHFSVARKTRCSNMSMTAPTLPNVVRLRLRIMIISSSQQHTRSRMSCYRSSKKSNSKRKVTSFSGVGRAAGQFL